jgi:high affinity sulfate transporter 1
MREYRAQWLRPDLVAGLTAAAVVIPKSLAYATVAGLPVSVGLYTALVPMAVYAFLGSSRPLSVSTTTTIAILTGAALASVHAAGAGDLATACATLTVLVGALLVLASLLRLGFIADFISEPVLVGLKAGIGAVIVVDQIPKLLGLHFHKGSFAHNVAAIVQGLPQTSSITLLVGALTIAVLLAIERFAPRLPAPLIAVGGAIAAVRLLGLGEMGVATVGKVPTGLPQLTWPSAQLMSELWPAALGIAVMSFTETIAAGRAFARRTEPMPQANQELFATGLANAAAAFLGAMPAGGGTSQTAVNREAGAQTQMAGAITAAVTLATLLLLAPLIGLMPEATLAAVVIVYSIGLIQPREFRSILTVRRTEFVWALVACVGVILVGTLQGIVVAIIVSLAALAYQSSDPPVHVLARKPGTNVFRPRAEHHPDDETFPGLLLLRPEGRVFFANAQRVGQKILAAIAQSQPRVVVLDLSGVFDLEYTALKMLTEAQARHSEQGVELWLAGLTPGVLAMVQRSALGAQLGQAGLLFNLEEAVARHAVARAREATSSSAAAI